MQRIKNDATEFFKALDFYGHQITVNYRGRQKY
jgi:hypothetical protein